MSYFFSNNIVIRCIRWFYDNYKYGCDRKDMRHMHTLFSEFMLPRIDYLIKNLEHSSHTPLRLNESGEVVGTLSVQEWHSILVEIRYALLQDVEPAKIVIDGQVPHNLVQVSAYLQNVEKDSLRYRNGLLLLGRYYSDLWG